MTEWPRECPAEGCDAEAESEAGLRAHTNASGGDHPPWEEIEALLPGEEPEDTTDESERESEPEPGSESGAGSEDPEADESTDEATESEQNGSEMVGPDEYQQQHTDGGSERESEPEAGDGGGTDDPAEPGGTTRESEPESEREPAGITVPTDRLDEIPTATLIVAVVVVVVVGYLLLADGSGGEDPVEVESEDEPADESGQRSGGLVQA